MEGYGLEYDEGEELIQKLARGANVAGVWIPSSTHDGSLTDKDFPALDTIHSSHAKGGSSSAGWGLNAGEKWKPISLPKGDSLKTAASTILQSMKGEKTKIKSSIENEVIDTEIIIGKDELMKTVLSKLSVYTALVQGGEAKITSGGPPKVVLDVKRRAGNKDVTIVRGLQSFGLSNEIVSKDWQKQFACSVSVNTIAGMVKEKEVVIQGNMINELERCLYEQWHIPRDLINANGKVKEKGKSKK